MPRLCLSALSVMACLFASLPAAHAQISDPANDFLPTYQGLHGGDLDVISADGTFNGSNFIFTATMNAPLFTTPNASSSNALYVWGINRGKNTVGFPTLAPGVLFDTVVVVTLQPGGGILGTAAGNNIASNVTISGSNITVSVPAAFLPSQGFALSDYSWNLWPRGTVNANGAAISGLAAISDFAPDNSNVGVKVTPEPSAAALFATALLSGAGFFARRRRSRK